MSEVFDGADFYSCWPAERYYCTTPQEAVCEFIGALTRDDAVKILDARMGDGATITVTSYWRRRVGPDWVESFARSAAETVVENFEDEFGGGDEPMVSSPTQEGLVKLAIPMVSAMLDCCVVWQCNPGPSKEYTKEQAIAFWDAENSK